MKTKWKPSSCILLAFLLLIACTIPTAYAAWSTTVYNAESVQTAVTTIGEAKVVCYVENSSGTKYYGNINPALNYAASNDLADTIYVVPNVSSPNNPLRLNASHTIASGDTLLLRYAVDVTADDGTVTTEYRETEYLPNQATSKNTTPHAYDDETGCQAYIEVPSGYTLANNGTITIGAQQNTGTGGNTYNGNACGEYTEIHLSGSAQLINKSGSTLNCYGYVSGDLDESGQPLGLVTNESGSTVNQFTTVIEHRGGQVFLGMSAEGTSALIALALEALSDEGAQANLKTFPFNRFFFGGLYNIGFRYNYGSSMNGIATLYANDTNNTTTMNVIGTSDCIINLQSSAYLTGWFSKETEVTKFNTFGSWDLGNIQFLFTPSFSDQSLKVVLNSANIFLPVSYLFDVTLSPLSSTSTASVTATSQKFKLMPGSSLTIDEGVVLTTNDVFIYTKDGTYYYRDDTGNYIDEDGINYSTNQVITPEGYKYPLKEDAKLIVNGTLSAASIGGPVLSASTSGVLNVGSSNQSSSTEIIDASKDVTAEADLFVTEVSVDYKEPEYETYTLSVTGKTDANGTISKLYSSTTYTYENGYWAASGVANVYVAYEYGENSETVEAVFDINYEDGSSIRFSSYDGYQAALLTAGTKFTLTKYHGLTGFKVNGEDYVDGTELTASNGMVITAVLAPAYAVTITMGGSALTYSCTLTVNAYDISGTGYEGSIISIDSYGQELTKTAYISTLDKFTITCGGNVVSNTDDSPLIEGATLTDGYYYPSGSVSIYVDTLQAVAMDGATLEVTNDDATTADTSFKAAAAIDGGSATFNLKFTLDPSAQSEIASVTWTATRAQGYANDSRGSDNASPGSFSTSLSDSDLNITEVEGTHYLQWIAKLPAMKVDKTVNSGSGSYWFHYYYRLAAHVTDILGNELTVYINGNSSYYLDAYYYNSGGCLAEGTMVTMADGSLKPIEDIGLEEKVMAYSLFDGRYEPQSVIFTESYEKEERPIYTLHFDDGTYLETYGGQSYFDLTSREYIKIIGDDTSYIGRTIMAYEGGSVSAKTITGITSEVKEVAVYDIVTEKNWNCVANGTLTTGPVLVNLNLFEVGTNLKYDEEKMEADVAQYGLYEYRNLAFIMTEEQFDRFNAKYIKVAVGKGLLDLVEGVEIFSHYLSAGQII